MRFESGLTRMTMRLQAGCEAEHVRRADLVMTTSAYSAGQIRQLYGVSQPPRIVPELIDLAAWEHLAQNSAPTPVHKFIVLTVCRFYPEKRLPVLLAAADRLRSRIPGLEVRIVGGGAGGEPSAGYLPAKKSGGDCGLAPQPFWAGTGSRVQPMPHLLPAQCSGRIRYRLPGGHGKRQGGRGRAGGSSTEVVRHGLLAEPDNDRDLADAIERLYREPLLRESMGNAGREYVRRFDAPVVGRMFLRELEEFMARRAGTMHFAG